jgi:predicted TIM-barrel fold metal-dependent hydrolase
MACELGRAQQQFNGEELWFMATADVISLLDSVPMVDVDSHILEPPDLWTSRLPAKWRDLAPRVVLDEASGQERWNISGKFAIGAATYASAGWKEFWPSRPTLFEQATRGAWDPKIRLEWMDRVGVHSQVLYPNILGFHIANFMMMDEPLRLACVQAYNDFQAEFAATDPKRLIPLCYLPWWDLDAAAKELERSISIGHKGVNFGSEFEKLGYPRLRDDHWHPLLRQMEEMGVSVNFHIGFGSKTEEEIRSATSLMQDSLDMAKTTALFMLGNANCIAELIFGQICHKYPGLKFVSVESGYGFIPYLLEAFDWQFLNTGAQANHPDMMLPSEYFKRQIYASFWFEEHLVPLLHLYPDNVMFETDYPHSTSLSPGENSHAKSARETVIDHLADVPENLLRKILHDNAAKVYDLD